MKESLNAGSLLFGPGRAPPRTLGTAIVATADRPQSRDQVTYLGRMLTPHLSALLEESLRWDLGGCLAAALGRLVTVSERLSESVRHPVDPIHVPIAEWPYHWSTKPALDVYINDQLFTRFALEVCIELDVKAIDLQLQAGRLAGIGAGTWAATAILLCNGRKILERPVTDQPLPGVIDFRQTATRRPPRSLVPASWPPPTHPAN